MRVLALLSLALLAGCKEKASTPLRVAAAADLTDVFTTLAQRFETETGVKVDLVFGSSGLLSKQAAEGAPYDVFAPASRGAAEEAVKAGACDADTLEPLARGRIVLWPGGGSDLGAFAKTTGRVAIANPEHAPYGRAAKQALERAGVWQVVEPRVVFTENVRAALRYVDSGEAAYAFVAWSNVVGRKSGAQPIDTALHDPLQQVTVRCKRGQRADDAKRFVEFLHRPESRETMQAGGLEPP